MRFVLLIFICLVMGIPAIQADNSNLPQDNNVGNITTLRLKNKSKYKRMPSNVTIDCYVGDCIIFFPEVRTDMAVTVTNTYTAEVAIATVTSECNEVEFSGDEGIYTIECHTADNQIFLGEFSI